MVKSNKTEIVKIRIDPETRVMVENAAEEACRSFQDQVRYILRQWGTQRSKAVS